MSRRLLSAASVISTIALGRAAAAQDLPLKRTPPAATVVACPAFTAPATPVRAQIDESNRLATLGQEAAIEGDHASARGLFQQAAQINQSDASLAFRLAHEQEEIGDKAAAVHEYCRYLYLSPTAGDATQINDKIKGLIAGPDLARGTATVNDFATGVRQFDSGSWGNAAEAFTAVTNAAPGFSAAYYDRALARAHQHKQTAAIQDFEHYLTLAPTASDRQAVRQRELELRHSLPSASKAFWIGLLPGGGQYYTGQPLLGVVVTGLAGGAVVWGIQSQTVTKTGNFIDANGRPYTQTFQATEHQHLAAGIGAAAAVTLLGAVEAAVVAHNRSSGLPPLADSTVASTSSGALPPRFRPPSVVTAGGRLGLALNVEFR